MPQPDYASLYLHAKVDELVAPYLAEVSNAGVVVGILRGDERLVFGYGRLAKDRDGVPDEHAVFEIGSVTKVFTAHLLADMVARGEVALDDPVGKYLPESVQVPTYRDQEITLFHLATHTSALPRLPANLDATVKDEANPYADYTAEQLYEALAKTRLRRPPGVKADYSNYGAGLLGHALALRAGKPYEELVLERVCRPAGLLDTTITLNDDQRRRLAPGHDEAGEPTANWDLPALAGAGALRGTVAEMLRWLEVVLHPPNTSLREAVEACQVVHRLERRYWAWGYAYAVALTAVGLGVQGVAQLQPGGALFSALLFAPVILAAWLGGFGPGMLAAGLSVLCTRLYFGEDFAWGWPVLVAPALAAVFSLWDWMEQREVCLGWQLSRLPNDVPLVWHNGGTGGYRSWVGFVRDSRVGVVVLANSANDVDGIGEGLVKYLHDTNRVWAAVERAWHPVRPR